MGSPFFGLDIALTGLYTSQIQLNTATHNVSNVETEGYTRQSVTTKAADAMETNSRVGMVGTGVVATDITQVRNNYYDVKYRRSNGIYGEYEAKSYYLSEMQNYLNELDQTGFTTIYDNFYNAMTNVSNDPTDLDKRQQVAMEAQTMMDYFNTLYGNLQTVQADLNSEVRVQVQEVNSIANEIAELNIQINTFEMNGGTANDLRDQRNLLIDKLSNLADVSVEERTINKEGLNMGSKTFMVKINGQVLVDTNRVNQLKCVVRDPKENQNDVDGLYDVVWSTTGEKLNITGNNSSGRLKALLDVRDGNNGENLNGVINTIEGSNKAVMYNTNINQISMMNMPEQGIINVGGNQYEYDGFSIMERSDGSFEYTFNLTTPAIKTEYAKPSSVGTTVNSKGVPYFQAQINEFLRTFSSEFNGVHKTGEDLYSEVSNTAFFVYKEGIEGKTMEDIPGIYEKDGIKIINSSQKSYYKMTGANIKVNDTIMDDPRKIAAAEHVVNGDGKVVEDGVSNRANIDKLIALKSDVNMFKQGSPSSFLQSIVSEIGVVTRNAKTLSKNQNNIVDSIEEMRLSTSGVDLDEEGMDLIRFQKAYELSCKVFSVMNEIYQKLINETGI